MALANRSRSDGRHDRAATVKTQVSEDVIAVIQQANITEVFLSRIVTIWGTQVQRLLEHTTGKDA